MSGKRQAFPVRWVYLGVGVAALLFAGIIYGWSILKAPLADAFGWTAPQLALNFTLTMWFFCVGGFVGGIAIKRLGSRVMLILAGAVTFLGFFLISRLNGSIMMLYIGYGVLAGTGIGIAYNVIISTVSAWFPDKKGTCSGTLMMGFGASALVVGNLASALIDGPGWRTAYLTLGACLGIILVIAGLVLRRPSDGTILPEAPKKEIAAGGEDFEARDYTTGEMMRRFTFWRAFLCIVCLSAVGNTVISFARDLALSVGASAALATTLVGVLSICNGLGRIVTGALFDKMGRKKTMLIANVLAIAAAATTLFAVMMGSLPLCVIGLGITGFSYGASPTISSAFTSAFYGAKHFPLNFSVMNFNLVAASSMATAASGLLVSTGSYVGPLVFLLVLAAISLLLDLSIKKP
ncbi:MFS transporter [Ruminococcaceae bacterium OttesenSCG-928-D13]|nr:MFS transporter [Ruminococcaceae bacterium OttesenSCG-928-D13]